MPVRHAVWKVGDRPIALRETSLDSEKLLETMIVRDPTILSDQWLVIGRQVRTSHGGYVDLLALNPDGHVVVVELKRDQTPREVIAQALDYASWAQDLEPEAIASIFHRFSDGQGLEAAFAEKFGVELNDEQLNGAHQIVIVAGSLDASTERIVNYLNRMELPVNVLFFQVFEDEGRQYLSRAWLIDPIETETRASSQGGGQKGDWNGEYYVSFGHGRDRNWDDAVCFGFICGGGGTWYSQTLNLLSAGDRVWVNIPKIGYVGVAQVLEPSVPTREFEVDVDGHRTLFLDVANANYHREFIEDDEKCEYFVRVKWLEKRPIEDAVSEIGFFGNQNTACRPRTSKWDHTVERLMRAFSSAGSA